MFFLFLGDGNFCVGRVDGDYEREEGVNSFFFHRCFNEVCSLQACVKNDEVFVQDVRRCKFIFDPT